MAVRLSALRICRPLPPGRFLALRVRLEGLGELKNPMNSSGIEPVTFRLVKYATIPRAPCATIVAEVLDEIRIFFHNILFFNYNSKIVCAVPCLKVLLFYIVILTKERNTFGTNIGYICQFKIKVDNDIGINYRLCSVQFYISLTDFVVNIDTGS
jgi:hypothetical protein